jgi:putative NADH-flavin reductase
MMLLAILGATGRTGTPLVRDAIAAGHEVRALVRSPEKGRERLGDHERLELVTGDALDAGSVHDVVSGADAVIDVTGPTAASPGDLRRRAAPVLVAAMGSAGVDRLVALTGAGVRAEGDRPKVADRLIRGVMRVVARDALHDGDGYVATVRSSDLRWTVVRAPRLVDASARGGLRVVPHLGGDVGTKLGRDDLAAFLLATAVDGGHVHELPVVSW